MKILIVGDSGVGKTAIMTRFTKDQFSQNHVATIGIDYMMKKVEVDGTGL